MRAIESKIQEYFSEINIKLTTKPAEHLVHQYADFVEIISLFSNENYLSKSDILDRFIDQSILKKANEDLDRAERNDSNETFINGIFNLILDRTYLYNKDYPFEILDNKIKLLPKSIINDRHKIYIMLLISSNLSLFSLFQPELTSEFETLCYNVLKWYLPSDAKVIEFGKNCVLIGNAKQKITQLATELNVEIDTKTLNQIPDSNKQERGLDIVGWIPSGDFIPNTLWIFCQCACGKDWTDKLTETRRYNLYYRFHRNKPVHTLFIPYSLIDIQSSYFYQSDEIPLETLLFERKRILTNIRSTDFFNLLKSKQIVEKAIETEEDIL